MTTPRQELLDAFAKMEARDQARREAADDCLAGSDSLERLGPPPHTRGDTIGDVIDRHYTLGVDVTAEGVNHSALPFEPERQCTYGSDRNPNPDEEEATMGDEAMLAGAFFAKHTNAQAVEIIRHHRFERKMQPAHAANAEVRYEAWIKLDNGHTIIERGCNFDELIQIAEQPAR